MKSNLIIFLMGVLLANVCIAADRIEIVKAEGAISVNQASGGKPKAVAAKSILPAANILSTGENGRAVVRVGNTGYIVLEKNSQIETNMTDKHAGFFRQLTGVVYYAVNTINGKDHPLEVRMKTSTIGIRGTRFLVTDAPDHSEIGMRKGTVSVTSLNEEFEIHKRSDQDEVEAMRQEAEDAVNKEKAEFETHKENLQHEFIEYKRELSLEADRMLSIDGKRADNRPLDEATKAKLKNIESYAGEWLNKVQD